MGFRKLGEPLLRRGFMDRFRLGSRLAGGGDAVAPTVTISSTESSPTFAATIPLTITFSEAVTGFVEGDIIAAGVTFSNFVTSDNIVWTVDATPTAFTVTVDIPAGVCVDAAGNANTAASQFAITALNANNLTLRLTVPIAGLSNLDVVNTWPNDGSFAADATTADVAAYVYKTNIINSLPAVDVDPATTFMTVAAMCSAAYDKALTVYIVAPGITAGTSGGATLIKNKALNAGVRMAKAAKTVTNTMVATILAAQGISDTTLFNNWITAITYDGVRARQSVNGNDHDTPFTSNLALAGDFVIGGIAGQAANYRLDGQIAEILVYNAALSNADFDIPLQYLSAKYDIPLCTHRIYTEGDSLTTGYLGTAGEDYPHVMMRTLPDTYYLLNGAAVGSVASNVESLRGATANQYFHTDATSIAVLWIGTNDIAGGVDATTIYNNIVAWHNARSSYNTNYKTIACTIIDRTGFDAAKDAVRATLNSSIVSNWATFSDALCDLAADARLSDATDTTYFNADGTHLNDAGYAVVAELVKAAVETID